MTDMVRARPDKPGEMHIGLRIARHGADAREAVHFTFDGEPVPAFQGESIGAALWAVGYRALRYSPVLGMPRGMFCVMGSCQECVVLVDGETRTACNTPVQAGLAVRRLVTGETTPK